MSEYVIETYGLTKIYRSGGGTVVAVDRLDFKVEKSSIFGLLGPNGAGKTTLLMMLTGLILPTSGSGKVLGYDIVRESREVRRMVGFLPEGFGLYEHLTAEQNLEYIAALNDIPKPERRKRIEDILAIVGLYEVKDRRVSGFSRGMKQRLGIAQALLKDPELLIMDEPTAGLDPEGSKTFKDLVSKLNSEGRTIVLSTHLLFEVGPLCSSIAIMNRGRIVVQGRVRDLVSKLMSEEGYKIYVEVRGDSGRFASALMGMDGVRGVRMGLDGLYIDSTKDIRVDIVKIASELSIEVSSIRVEEPSLEDLFMRYYRGGGVDA
ncbi:MAG: ABC transporter ATP-binding protein [Nitrososphaerota archaeon]|nr:ABC transporter ATP-binding protein [Candidatus Bathyarchaeota archaeon]MDW8062039.1 ABC transporter ATP-binding protein [Nitrososphaerota archaeon]